MKRKKDKSKGVIAEFKAFITRGNVIDLAVGVIIGGAFTLIVNALTNHVIMPLINVIVYNCTGGKGIDLVTPLNDAPRFIEVDGVKQVNPDFIGMDWGILINALINFFLIALVLFAIIKTINSIHNKKEKIAAKLQEEYYKKHPEERPADPVPEEPKPTELDVLSEIRDLLKEKDNKPAKKSK